MNRHLPIGPGSSGAGVLDLRARLDAAGFGVATLVAEFSGDLSDSLQAFQSERGLHVDGVCDADTWAALVEAGFFLGDRLLYSTAPMLRGDDVSDLQMRLGCLGFHSGRVDGIFGPQTRAAVGAFQRDLGLVCDAVVGPETVAAVQRLQPRGGSTSVAGVRERIALRAIDTSSTALAFCHLTADDRLAVGVGGALIGLGLAPHLISEPTWSDGARTVNALDVDVCIALEVRPADSVEISYFATEGYQSHAGERLAGLIADEIPALSPWPLPIVRGMRLPILRETRAPSVHLTIGGPELVHQHRHLIATAIERAIIHWSSTSS